MNLRGRPAGRAGIAADALFAVLSTALLVFTATRFAQEDRDWMLDAGVSVAMGAAALARRRHPVAAPSAGLAMGAAAAIVAAATGAPTEPGASAILALMVLACTAVRVLPAAAATAITLCGVPVAGAGRLATAFGHQASHAAYMFSAQGWLVAVGLGLWLRYLDRRRRDTADAVRRDERLAMARELHDVVAHHITGIVVQTQAARIAARRQAGSAGLDERGGPGDPGLDDALAEIEAAGGDALAAMRRVVSLLRDNDDAVTTGTGTGTGTGREQLTELVERFDGHGPAVTLRLPERDEASWPPEVASTVYRVVQESLTNIARHAVHARSASVEITRNPAGITVEVTDDAPPGAPRHLHRGGFGLIGMRERVEALGGTLEAGPRAAGTGWAVTATMPVTGVRP